MKVVLGVAGGIAAYKAASLLRLFTEAGHDLTVVPTASALHFVGEATWSALSGKPVHTDVWSDITDVPHVRIGQQADLVIVAPATADLLARAASGQADDLLTNVLLTARCPVVMAPAMHTEMWEHPATQANVATLSERGVHIVPPASGRLTGKDTGPGRLPEPEELYAVCARLLEHPRAVAATAPVTEVIPTRGPLRGRHVVVSAGGTREPLDPVRFLGNRSSGKQGYAVAAAAAARGARVTLVTTADLQLPTASSADRACMPIQPAEVAPDLRDHRVELQRGVERLHRRLRIAELVRHRGDAAGPVIVGFAAETGDAKASVLEHGRAKLERKGCDVLVVNEVGSDKTFGKDENTVHLLLQGSSRVEDVGPADKRVIADAIWDLVETLV